MEIKERILKIELKGRQQQWEGMGNREEEVWKGSGKKNLVI